MKLTIPIKSAQMLLPSSSIKLASDSDSLYGNTLIGGSLKNAAQHIQLQGTAHKRDDTNNFLLNIWQNMHLVSAKYAANNLIKLYYDVTCYITLHYKLIC